MRRASRGGSVDRVLVDVDTGRSPQFKGTDGAIEPDVLKRR